MKTLAMKYAQYLKKNTKNFKTIGLILLIFMPTSLLAYYFIVVKTSYLSDLSIEGDYSFNRFNSSRWITPSFQATDFEFEIETYGLDNPYRPNITYSVNYYNMGVSDWFKANKTEWGEWGYSFHHLYGQMDGAGMMHYGKYPTPPQTKLEAYTYMQQYIVNRTKYIYNNLRPWLSFNGHYPYHHYAAEFGFDYIGSEIGENIDSYQLMMAFNRGAARQYHLPWFVDVSAWNSGTITDANVPSWWPDNGGAEYGHSLSLFRRTYYMTYMAGTSRLIAEGGFGNLFYRNSADANGLMTLTPLGETVRDFVHVINGKDNGISYTPIGIVLDELHGTIGFDSKEPKAFYAIPYTEGDYMNYDLFNLLFPKCFKSPDKEIGALTNNEFGDLFDIMLQNASAYVFAAYPFLLLSGDIHFRKAEIRRLIQYVANGGNLIVNSAYFDAINSGLVTLAQPIALQQDPIHPIQIIPYPNQNGGNFLLYRSDYSTYWLQPLLRELIPKLLPFTLLTSGTIGIAQGPWGAENHIEYLINRNEHSWILTLINNDGITKEPKLSPVIDQSQSKSVQIKLNSAFITQTMGNHQLSSIKDWIVNSTIYEQDPLLTFNSLEYSVSPGEIVILEFVFSD